MEDSNKDCDDHDNNLCTKNGSNIDHSNNDKDHNNHRQYRIRSIITTKKIILW